MNKQIFGDQSAHPSISVTLSTLAVVLQAQGKLDGMTEPRKTPGRHPLQVLYVEMMESIYCITQKLVMSHPDTKIIHIVIDLQQLRT